MKKWPKAWTIMILSTSRNTASKKKEKKNLFGLCLRLFAWFNWYQGMDK